MAKISQPSTNRYRACDFGAKCASFIVNAAGTLSQEKSTSRGYEGNRKIPEMDPSAVS
jgi:hypothetical protein